MAQNRGGSVSEVWHRLTGLFGKRGAGQLFIDPRAHSWARPIKSASELPSQYRSFFESRSIGSQGALPYSVLTPTFRGGYGRPEPERLLCILDGCVYVLECAGGRLECTCYAPENVIMIEYGVLLLQSWITMEGQDSSGALLSTTVRFNSVTDYLMVPFVDCLRGPAVEGSDHALELERAKLDYLAESHFKFRTYGRASLRMGASLSQAIFQPEIRRLRLKLPGISLARLVSPAHLSILSNNELIRISDDPGQRWARGSPHGAIWTYIPRSKIAGAALAARGDGTQELAIDLGGGRCIRSLFGSEAIPRLEQLLVELSSADALQTQRAVS